MDRSSHLWVIGILIAVGSPAQAEAATIKRVYTTSTTLNPGFTGKQITLGTPVANLARTILVFSASPNTDNSHEANIAGSLDSTTLVRFNQGATSNVTIPLTYSLIEFDSGVTVQRGRTTITDTVTNISIGSVNLAQSFAIVTFRTAGTSLNGGDFVRARLTSSTNLEISTDLTPSAGSEVAWQVVTMDNVQVTHGTAALGSGDLSETVAVTASLSKTWLLYSYRAVGSDTDFAHNAVQGRLGSASQLIFDRRATGNVIEVAYSLVTFTDTTVVRQGSSEVDNVSTLNVPIASVDPAYAFATGGYLGRGGNTSTSSAKSPGAGWMNLRVANATTLEITRTLADPQSDMGWFVVAFTPPAAPPPPPTDTTPPSAGAVRDGLAADIDEQSNNDSISANWSGFADAESGIDHYEWAIGTSAGGTQIQAFVSVGSLSNATASGLVLSNTTYYVTVKAVNGKGLSTNVSSDGVTVNWSAPPPPPPDDGVDLPPAPVDPDPGFTPGDGSEDPIVRRSREAVKGCSSAGAAPLAWTLLFLLPALARRRYRSF